MKRKKITDKVGMRFGKLLVVEKLSKVRTYFMYRCVCDCGNEMTIATGNLREGKGMWGCGCGRYPTRPRHEYGNASMKGMYRGYINGAKERGIEFSLDLNYFHEITQQNCFYCGKEPKQRYKSSKGTYGEYIYNGIDRVDSSKGYVLGNCVPCCGECNWAKNSRTQKEFLDWIYRVYMYNFVKAKDEDNCSLSYSQ